MYVYVYYKAISKKSCFSLKVRNTGLVRKFPRNHNCRDSSLARPHIKTQSKVIVIFIKQFNHKYSQIQVLFWRWPPGCDRMPDIAA